MRVLIDNIFQAKRELAKAYRDYKADKITTEKYRSMVYGLSKLIESIYKYEVESELEEIKERLENETKKY